LRLRLNTGDSFPASPLSDHAEEIENVDPKAEENVDDSVPNSAPSPFAQSPPKIGNPDASADDHEVHFAKRDSLANLLHEANAIIINRDAKSAGTYTEDKNIYQGWAEVRGRSKRFYSWKKR
jgi:hypothetical protein